MSQRVLYSVMFGSEVGWWGCWRCSEHRTAQTVSIHNVLLGTTSARFTSKCITIATLTTTEVIANIRIHQNVTRRTVE